ncbi:hypothetical protein QR680_010438 [Steinernema hermaphroditum]|uniref:Uncharacterized protein n=1 Tax=Steinernema hermaphroditum TaxID=289476 RepID=A0AA39IQT5_9BILA|nr:hypothetical protein QR680_010438 [Steinernema hermaphroditum]
MASPRIHSPVDRQQEVDKLLFDLDKFFSNLQNAGNLIVEAAELGSSALRRFNGEAEKNGSEFVFISKILSYQKSYLHIKNQEKRTPHHSHFFIFNVPLQFVHYP